MQGLVPQRQGCVQAGSGSAEGRDAVDQRGLVAVCLRDLLDIGERAVNGGIAECQEHDVLSLVKVALQQPGARLMLALLFLLVHNHGEIDGNQFFVRQLRNRLNGDLICNCLSRLFARQRDHVIFPDQPACLERHQFRIAGAHTYTIQYCTHESLSSDLNTGSSYKYRFSALKQQPALTCEYRHIL